MRVVQQQHGTHHHIQGILIALKTQAVRQVFQLLHQAGIQRQVEEKCAA